METIQTSSAASAASAAAAVADAELSFAISMRMRERETHTIVVSVPCVYDFFGVFAAELLTFWFFLPFFITTIKIIIIFSWLPLSLFFCSSSIFGSVFLLSFSLALLHHSLGSFFPHFEYIRFIYRISSCSFLVIRSICLISLSLAVCVFAVRLICVCVFTFSC